MGAGCRREKVHHTKKQGQLEQQASFLLAVNTESCAYDRVIWLYNWQPPVINRSLYGLLKMFEACGYRDNAVLWMYFLVRASLLLVFMCRACRFRPIPKCYYYNFSVLRKTRYWIGAITRLIFLCANFHMRHFNSVK